MDTTTRVHRTGAYLRDRREAEGLTQEEVAEALGVVRQTVNAWEQRAVVKAPKAEKYLRVVSELASRNVA